MMSYETIVSHDDEPSESDNNSSSASDSDGKTKSCKPLDCSNDFASTYLNSHDIPEKPQTRRLYLAKLPIMAMFLGPDVSKIR